MKCKWKLSEKTKEKMRKKISWKENSCGCWICTSHARDGEGYPGIWVNVKRIKLSRYMYSKFKGEIPENMVVRHTCDNRMCINPNHLVVGTQFQNMRDSVERGTRAKGEKHGMNKLSEEDVKKIYSSLRGRGVANKLSKKYGVDSTNIWSIWRGKSWSWLTSGLDD